MLDICLICYAYINSFFLREEANVKFPKASGPSCLTEDYYAIEDQIKTTEWKKERISDELGRERALLKQAKVNFDVQQQELIQFLAQRSNHDQDRVMFFNI